MKIDEHRTVWLTECYHKINVATKTKLFAIFLEYRITVECTRKTDGYVEVKEPTINFPFEWQMAKTTNAHGTRTRTKDIEGEKMFKRQSKSNTHTKWKKFA